MQDQAAWLLRVAALNHKVIHSFTRHLSEADLDPTLEELSAVCPNVRCTVDFLAGLRRLSPGMA